MLAMCIHIYIYIYICRERERERERERCIIIIIISISSSCLFLLLLLLIIIIIIIWVELQTLAPVQRDQVSFPACAGLPGLPVHDNAGLDFERNRLEIVVNTSGETHTVYTCNIVYHTF